MLTSVELFNLYHTPNPKFKLVLKTLLSIEVIIVDELLCMLPVTNQLMEYFYLYQISTDSV